MILRCRTCGKDNRVDGTDPVFHCQSCGAEIDPYRAKLIEPEPTRQSDPLADFR